MIRIVMGVSGCGKSTVAQALADHWGAEFLDADPFHPPTNVDKMSRGIPLTDEDRAGWLANLASMLNDRRAAGTSVVLACSALKEAYRDVLRVAPEVRFVYLEGTFDVIEARMKAREGHFMKAGMLESQFRTLEPPACGPGTDAVAVDLGLPVATIVERVATAFDPDGRVLRSPA